MSKYKPLEDYLSRAENDNIQMRFTDIENVIGFKLPASSHRHRAWWSNNTSNNVMTFAWMNAGFETEDVDMAGKRLVFRRVKRNSNPKAAPKKSGPKRSPLFGALKGMLRLRSDVDYTAPNNEDWA